LKRLNKLYWLKKEIEQIEMQIKELTILSAMAMNGMPSGNSVSSPVEKFYDRLDKLRAKLQAKLNEYITEKERIEDYIENIEDTEIRVIARMRFVDNLDFQTIGNEMYMDRTTAYRKLKNYIEKDGKIQ
jgi:predicted DNA-binding protein